MIAAHKHGIIEVAKIYDISFTSLTAWIHHLKSKSIEKLEAPKSRKRKTKLDIEQMNIVKSWIQGDSNITIKALKIKILDLLQNLIMPTPNYKSQQLD